ncbi:hypothetical protein D3C75_366330 [compost metagenome]
MAAVAERCARRIAPATGFVGHCGTGEDAVIENGDRGVRVGSAGERRGRVVSDLAAGERGLDRPDVIRGCRNRRRGWSEGVDRQRDSPACRGAVARSVGGAKGEGACALGQRIVRRKGPAPGGVHHRAANLGAIAEDADRRAHFAAAGEGWAGIVGDIAADQGSGNRADIVDHGEDHRSRWRRGVNADREGWRGA